MEGINSPTSVVSQEGLAFIRRKFFFQCEIFLRGKIMRPVWDRADNTLFTGQALESRKTSFKEQNRETHGSEWIIPHVTGQAESLSKQTRAS